ncbi:hypothetical protein [Demequina sp. B12]|uniref:hypothetical protein n=1 Tax=Demequina sp. B12 TaxID=2992757 RepID=UPI00237BFB87|nr:hypothetical protein [Demequina sp. B12]
MSHIEKAGLEDWDPVTGTGSVVTNDTGRHVWIHYSMHDANLDPLSLSLGDELLIAYQATVDQDGFVWIGVRVSHTQD